VGAAVLRDETDWLLVAERMKWQKVIAGNNLEINRCAFWDGDRRGCWPVS
jgi:hypothetical protein